MGTPEVTPVIDRGLVLDESKPKIYKRGVVKVTGIPKYLESGDLKAWASQFGEVKRACCWRKSPLAKRTNYGFVEYASAESAKIVATKMTGTMMMGKPLKLKFCADIGYELAKKLFPRGGTFKATKTVRDIAEEQIKARTTVIVKSEAEAEAVEPTYSRPCHGTKLLRESGITCDWQPFKTLAEALDGLQAVTAAN